MQPNQLDNFALAVQKHLPWLTVKPHYTKSTKYTNPVPGLKAKRKLSNGRMFWARFETPYPTFLDPGRAVQFFEKRFDDWLWGKGEQEGDQ